MPNQLTSIEELEQTDYLDNEYLEKAMGTYSRLIGLFLIKFSCLEHAINVAIADIIHNDSHDTGYIIIERLTAGNKIDCFIDCICNLQPLRIRNGKKGCQ